MLNQLSLRQNFKKVFSKEAVFSVLKSFIPYFLAVLIVLTSGYAKVTTRQGSFNSKVLLILLAVAIIFVVTFMLLLPKSFVRFIAHPIENKIYNKKRFYIAAITIIAILTFFTIYYFKGNEITTLAHYLLLIVFGFSFAVITSFKKFVRYYNNTFIFISIFSLILYVFAIFSKEANLFTAMFSNKNGILYYSYSDLFFFVNKGVPRNYGPFWEPGIYSLFLLVGIVFEILFIDKPRWFFVIVYGVSLLTTFSTSGIILAIFVAPLFFTKSNNKKIFYISLAVTFVLIFVFVLLGQPTFNIPFFSTVFSKLFSSAGLVSFTTRLLSPLYGLYLGMASFGIGYGPNIFDNLYEKLLLFGNTVTIAQTSTFGWLSGSFGIMGFIFCIACLMLIFSYLKNEFNTGTAVIVTFLTFFIINCEPMYAFSLFWVLFMFPIAWHFKRVLEEYQHNGTLYSSISKSNSGVKLTISNLSWSLIIKVAALLIGLLLYPLYVKYFGNKTEIAASNGELTTFGTVGLGAWLVILQILSWILTFDIGIGNGLKNKVVEAVNQNRRHDLKKYISCSYISNLIIISLLLLVGLPLLFSIDFNSALKISTTVISPKILKTAFALAFVSICLEFFFKIVLNIYQALQMQVVASITPLISTLLLLAYVSIVRIEDVNSALLSISAYYIFSVNFPLIILTIILFSKRFRDCIPSIKEWSFSYAKSIISLGGVYFLIQIFLLVINSTNKLIISNVYGPSFVANYEPYSKIFSAICAVGSAISLPIWTLTIRADVKKDYGWMKKMEKAMFALSVLFALGSFFAAAVLQILFNIWLKDETILVDYIKAFLFAFWASASICSYFVTAFSNGFKFLKPQIIVFGVGALIKLPIFMFVRALAPNVDWIILIAIDALIMTTNAVVNGIINHIIISKKNGKVAWYKISI